MRYFIGIDLGTSAVKLLLVGEDGSIARTVSQTYEVAYPHPGWSEQNPQDWWSAVVRGTHQLMEGIDPASVAALAVAGQMHGLVVLDKDDEVIRPCILWNDGRTAREVVYLNETIGRKPIADLTGNIAFAGFTAPKLLWLRKNEPENFARISKIMLPKDYLTYRMTGAHVTDYSDASGTLLLDVEHREWSEDMLGLCGVERVQMPRLLDSAALVGELTQSAASELGLLSGTLVAAGAGDNAAAAIGCGAIEDGSMNVSLGTSGTVFIPSSRFGMDKDNALHAFAYVEGRFHLMGCILAAASCTGWFVEDVLGEHDIDASEAGIEPNECSIDQPYFLPYLMGERSPHNDTTARGTFLGLRADTTRADMVRAVREGVAFAIRDCVEVARAQGIDIHRSTLCGGGAKSALMRQMMANILNMELVLPETEQGPGYGAALLAMVAAGLEPHVAAAATRVVRMRETIEPNPAAVALYEQRYRVWREFYPALSPIYHRISDDAATGDTSGAVHAE